MSDSTATSAPTPSTPGETSPGAVRLRVAPSPTGDPHVGTAYMAMFDLAFARQQGGKFVLRIEDTDRARFQADSEQQIFDTLHWLDLNWDEGPDVGGPYAPYRQSERLDTYKPYVDKLIDEGKAYYCYCTSERLAEMRELQQKQKLPTGYDRMCYGKSREERAAEPGFSENPVVRMFIPDDAPLVFDDLIRGEVKAPRPDDQVIMKADGFPTYHLAVVVDTTPDVYPDGDEGAEVAIEVAASLIVRSIMDDQDGTVVCNDQVASRTTAPLLLDTLARATVAPVDLFARVSDAAMTAPDASVAAVVTGPGRAFIESQRALSQFETEVGKIVIVVDRAAQPSVQQIAGVTVLRAGDAYERATPWRQRRPAPGPTRPAQPVRRQASGRRCPSLQAPGPQDSTEDPRSSKALRQPRGSCLEPCSQRNLNPHLFPRPCPAGPAPVLARGDGPVHRGVAEQRHF